MRLAVMTNAAAVMGSAPVVPGSQEYTTAGTFAFTPPHTGDYLVRVWGSGAAGVGQAGSPGVGGGGGAFSAAVLSMAEGVDETVVVGAGGTGGFNNSGVSIGNDSYVRDTSTVLACGAGRGASNFGQPPFGGKAADGVGATKYSGGDGVTSGTPSRGGGSSAGTAANGASGSSSSGGVAPAGGGNGGNGGSPGSAGSSPGGGGGGGAAGQNGGAGAAGKVVISWPA